MSRELTISRRSLMAAALTLPFASGAKANAVDAERIVSLDYGLASTLLMLGVTPVGISARADWAEWVVDPPMPDSVADLGTTSEINLEVLSRLKPSMILTTPYLAALKPLLEPIAPVEEFPLYVEGEEALPSSIVATRALGRLIGREPQAEDFLRRADTVFEDCRARIAMLSAPPVALINFMDERHARIYGGPGLYQGVLDRIGLANAWPGTANYWGFQTIALEELVALPADAHLMAFEPLTPANILQRLDDSPLWRKLPFVEAGQVSVLPGVLMFGMVREAMRFAQLVTDRLEQVC